MGGLVEQLMIRLVLESSEMALQREAVVVSSWTRPCRLAALINLIKTVDQAAVAISA